MPQDLHFTPRVAFSIFDSLGRAALCSRLLTVDVSADKATQSRAETYLSFFDTLLCIGMAWRPVVRWERDAPERGIGLSEFHADIKMPVSYIFHKYDLGGLSFE